MRVSSHRRSGSNEVLLTATRTSSSAFDEKDEVRAEDQADEPELMEIMNRIEPVAAPAVSAGMPAVVEEAEGHGRTQQLTGQRPFGSVRFGPACA